MKNINFLQGGKDVVLGIQHLIAMFGATTLVPLLLGMEVPVALFSAGAGTLLFHLVTKGKVPVFLGSSFAFIPVLGSVIAATDSVPHAQGAIIMAGLVYLLLSLAIAKWGVDKINKIFKPHIMSAIIVVIGLSLVPVAVDMSMEFTPLALQTFGTIFFIMAFFNGFIRKMSILLGLLSGYLVGAWLGMVDYELITQTPWFAIPNFTMPVFDFSSMIIIVPVVLAVFMEHLGDISANQKVVGKNFFKDPGIHKTLLGDGIATIFAGFIGGPANTTYSENTGVLAVTKNYKPYILRIAAISAILVAFFAKFGAVLQTIPVAVMGGASLMMFGMIAYIGVKGLVEQKFFKSPRKTFTVSVMLILGLQPFIRFGIMGADFTGVSIAAAAGIIISIGFHLYDIWKQKA